MTKERIDKLIAITKKKRELLDSLLTLTNKQTLEIEKEEMDKLNYILDKKDGIIKEIDRLDLDFVNIFSQIKRDHSIEKIGELDVEVYPNLKELKEEVKEITSILASLSLIDEKNTKFIKEKLKETKLELKKVKDGKKAYKGYNPTMVGSMLIDEKK
ncbi:MAG: flagellar protein FlgN [Tissierellia bacterium]|nr:flagellar protein FlgN [Tissierellia bacterium]